MTKIVTTIPTTQELTFDIPRTTRQMDSILSLEKHKYEIQEKLEQHARDLKKRLQPLNRAEPLFDQLLFEFRSLALPDNNIKRAAQEIFRRGAWEFEHRGYNYLQVVQFTITVNTIIGELYDHFDDAELGKGDDSYGDFMQALILCGRGLTHRILNGEFGSGKSLDINKLRKAIGKSKLQKDKRSNLKFQTYIDFTEPYVSMRLDDAMTEYLPLFIRTVREKS